MSQFLSQTFIIERLLGVFCYVLVIGATYNSIKNASTNYRFNRALNRCLIVLCIMAFFYVPAETSDLSRIWDIIRSWRNEGVNSLGQGFLSNTKAPGAYFLFYFAAKDNFPKLLPTVACLLYFSSFFYILKTEYKIGRASNKALAITYMFIMCQGLFLGVISGVRNGIAFALVLRAIYDNLCLKKKSLLSYVLCVIGASFHISTILIIGVYLIVSIFDAWKNGGSLRRLTSTTIIGMIIVCGIIFQSSLLNKVLATARTYFYGDIYSYFWEYVIVIASFLVLCAILACYGKIKDDDRLSQLYCMCNLFSLIVVIMLNSYTMFHRYANFAMLISIPIFAHTVDCLIEQERFKMIHVIKITCCLILVLACVRGDLCGYKFFLL